MARDRLMFDLLARTVDDLVDPSIEHVVVVPGSDVPAFKQYANARRTIVAQEDALPFKAIKLPTAPKLASRYISALRRPLYIERRLRLVRGWILQQALKFEMARTAKARLVLHVDSDVFFIRPMSTDNLFRDDRMPFFGANGGEANPNHLSWIHGAERLLGLPQSERYSRHFIENCVPWDSDAVRAMTQRMEKTAGRAWHDVLLSEKTLSEYYVYGVFIEQIHGAQDYWTEGANLCRSYWLDEDKQSVDEAWLLDGIEKHQVAMSVQSTNLMEIDHRRALCERARAITGY